MDAQILLNKLSELTISFNESFGSLSAEELNTKPDASTWSIAQNIEHLILTNQSYFSIIKKIIENDYSLPFSAKIPFLVNFFGYVIYKTVRPENKRKSKTFPVWSPSKSDLDACVLQKFSESQDGLKKLISSCGDLIASGKIISSPANKFIVYRLDRAFEIIVAHEARHYNQALNTKKNIAEQRR